MIGELIVIMASLSFEVSAQPTVNEDEAFCQTKTWEELVNVTRADMMINRATLDEVKSHLKSLQEKETGTARDVGLMKSDLAEVKRLLGPRLQQPCNSGAFDSSTLCECKIALNLFTLVAWFYALLMH